jgi:DNA-binding GntR family transcriptional regulator
MKKRDLKPVASVTKPIQLSLADQAYQKIKDGIIRYYFKPGTTLRISDLATMFEMSQTPVREALSKLEREHLIKRYPQKRYVVSILNAHDVENLFELRIAIEVLAVRQAATRATGFERKDLLSVMKKIESAIAAEDHGDLINFERQFHSKIMHASGNPYLSDIGEGILDRIWVIQSYHLITSDRLLAAHQQHLKVFASLEGGSPEEAAALMESHLKDAKQFLIQRLSNRDDFLSSLIDMGPMSSIQKNSI